jgi:hypothetical protein
VRVRFQRAFAFVSYLFSGSSGFDATIGHVGPGATLSHPAIAPDAFPAMLGGVDALPFAGPLVIGRAGVRGNSMSRIVEPLTGPPRSTLAAPFRME